MRINIVVPVLNEEFRIQRGIEQAVRYLEDHLQDKYQITIVDNGSTDNTETIAKHLVEEHKHISYMKLSQRGVGLALREAVKLNECEIIGYMDVDLSTDLQHIKQVYDLFENHENTKIVNGSRIKQHSNVKNRKLIREITSRGLNLILKILLGVKFTDAMCGFKFFNRNVIEDLIDKSSDNHGWFYCAELLVRAEWEGIEIQEIAVNWDDDPNSKVKIMKLVITYMKEIMKLRKEKGESHTA
ncbi:glycosyltransferase [Paenibacillus pini]|uniref:Dolichol-P-glucose synthetase n=1 Tax=Paenibacillus pini JCM 16418 TaxID=1236976 RepID=W7YUX2_9BACL|nr:glycosyltransferase [Paenibacillus pini]GAF08386.1 dolichol-P-glucose synthetase [Paenibacillus pini JCM 16418]